MLGNITSYGKNTRQNKSIAKLGEYKYYCYHEYGYEKSRRDPRTPRVSLGKATTLANSLKELSAYCELKSKVVH